MFVATSKHSKRAEVIKLADVGICTQVATIKGIFAKKKTVTSMLKEQWWLPQRDGELDKAEQIQMNSTMSIEL